MDSLLWIPVALIIIGFIILVSMKKSMESKLAFIKANMDSNKSSIKAKSIIWYIVSTTTWGIVSIILIVWSFHNHFR
ncbi:hypothetical protein [Pseudobacillus badius]|uniref:hypothetical protein n=1 Tax=Bacillus badius TaxID=1455 RepID=UPI001CBD8B8C|nr:hypothetical protein [Bacillus badius]MED0668081.1 hypothetical protein [Bacillus badius]GLY11952.1 hypothetical protein Bbad01_31680 [Bacillus badius]